MDSSGARARFVLRSDPDDERPAIRQESDMDGLLDIGRVLASEPALKGGVESGKLFPRTIVRRNSRRLSIRCLSWSSGIT